MPIRKKDISAISGHLCDRCLGFQLEYIKDMGIDRPASERHQCTLGMLGETNKLQNKRDRQNEMYSQVIDNLTWLTNSIFKGTKELVVDSSFDPSYLAIFHYPQIKLNFITPEHWAWRPIVNKKISLTQIDLQNFIKAVMGTYVFLSIQNGPYAGYHLMYVRRPLS